MYTTRVFEDNGGGLHAVVNHTYDGAPDYTVELFPQRMGYAGRQLFGLLHADD